jgi:hypothetical protein
MYVNYNNFFACMTFIAVIADNVVLTFNAGLTVNFLIKNIV